MMMMITFTSTTGRPQTAEVSEAFPHAGVTKRGIPVQVAWAPGQDWTEAPLDAPNTCYCAQCEPAETMTTITEGPRP